MKKVGIRGRLMVMMLTALILAILAASMFVRDQVYNNVIDQKRTVSKILTASIVHDIKYEYNYRKQVAIYNIISKYLNYHNIIEDIHYYAVDSSTVVGANKESVSLAEDIPADMDPKVKQAIDYARPSMEVEQHDGHLSISSIAPVLQGTRVMGAIVVNISIDDINDILSAIGDRIIMIMIIISVALVAVLYAFLHKTLLSRLGEFMYVTKEVSTGNYDVKLNDQSHDELARLALAFDQMTDDLRKSKIEIDNHNEIMDQKVVSATSELKKTYEDLKNAQGQIVLSEKMASLGILIAGIAHEINTPVGAISNVARHMNEKIQVIPDLMANYVDDDGSVPGDVKALLAAVLEKASMGSKKASFKATREIGKLLQDEGICDWRNMSQTLTGLGFSDPEEVQRHMSCLRSPKVFKLLETVGYISHSTRITETSTRKIHDIIHALKFYAYTDQDRVEKTPINDSVKTSMVLINNRVKHLVDIETDFANDLPPIPCTSEIHQIWTVLLNNAVDAIEENCADENGHIKIASYEENDAVCVSISDNGGGIPEEIQQKIFDPFFTTKDIGKGTGLGLSIVSGIVNKHGGTISIESHDGRTSFVVSIPKKGICLSDEHETDTECLDQPLGAKDAV